MPLPLPTLRWLGINDTECISYLSEIHAQMLELYITYVPTDYHSLLLFLLQPAIWQQKDSVPRSIPFNGDYLVIHNDAWGTGWLCKNNIRMWVFHFVTDCDRVVIDVIQCGPETIFPGNRLSACRRTGLTHMSTRRIWKSYQVNTLVPASWYHSALTSESNPTQQPCDLRAVPWFAIIAYSSSSMLDHTDRFERKNSPGLHFLNATDEIVQSEAVNFVCHSE